MIDCQHVQPTGLMYGLQGACPYCRIKELEKKLEEAEERVQRLEIQLEARTDY